MQGGWRRRLRWSHLGCISAASRERLDLEPLLRVLRRTQPAQHRLLQRRLNLGESRVISGESRMISGDLAPPPARRARRRGRRR